MKKIFVAIALFAALPLFAKYKVKQKSFEPIAVRDVHAIAGRYVGIEHEFEIELSVDANGKVSGVLERNAVKTPLEGLVIDGAELRSNIVRARFGDRVLNGDHRFGLLLSEPRVVEHDGQSLNQFFCRKW